MAPSTRVPSPSPARPRLRRRTDKRTGDRSAGLSFDGTTLSLTGVGNSDISSCNAGSSIPRQRRHRPGRHWQTASGSGLGSGQAPALATTLRELDQGDSVPAGFGVRRRPRRRPTGKGRRFGLRWGRTPAWSFTVNAPHAASAVPAGAPITNAAPAVTRSAATTASSSRTTSRIAAHASMPAIPTRNRASTVSAPAATTAVVAVKMAAVVSISGALAASAVSAAADSATVASVEAAAGSSVTRCASTPPPTTITAATATTCASERPVKTDRASRHRQNDEEHWYGFQAIR